MTNDTHNLHAPAVAHGTITNNNGEAPRLQKESHTMKTRTYTALIEVELQAPADATPSEVGEHIDACIWELGYEAPGISVNEVLVRCTEMSTR